MKSLWAVISLVLLSTPALSLSCMPSDIVNTYKEAAQSESDFIVVTGFLSFDKRKLPKIDFSNQTASRPNNWIKARMSGKSLTKTGFSNDFTRQIRLNVQCFGPWCAQPESGTNYLAFLEKTNSGYVLSLSPCGGFGYALPSKDLLNKVIGCFQGRACTPTIQ